MASYVRYRFIRTPLNLLFTCFSGMSLVTHVVMFFEASVAYPISLLNGICIWTEVDNSFLNCFVFALTSLTITMVALLQCLIIGGRSPSYRQVGLALILVWMYVLAISLITLIVEVTLISYYAPQHACAPFTLSQEAQDYRLTVRFALTATRGVMFDIPSLLLSSVSTITSCVRYHKNVIQREQSVQRKMLLLPILMIGSLSLTTLLSRLVAPLIPLFVHNLSRTQINQVVPAFAVVVRLLSQANSFMFAALLIFLNTAYRKGLKMILMDLKKRLFSKPEKKKLKLNRVHPETQVSLSS